MASNTLATKLRALLQRFGTAKAGNVTLTFAVATIPMVGFVGAAVDYSRANSAKAAMQAAVDATALMLSKDAATLTTAQMNTKASNYFAALFTRPEVANATVTPTFRISDGAQLVVTGTGVVQTSFMKVMGKTSMTVNVSSTVRWGNIRLRVALVLDTTGSMEDDGKIGALKIATKSLLTQLQNAAAQNGDVYVSIIPFSKDVNVDKVNYSATWIDWSDWNERNGSCSKDTWSYHYNSKSSCNNAGGWWTADNHNTWNGCVMDRGNSSGPSSSNYDQNVLAPGTSNASKFAAEQYSNCSDEVMPLNYNWSAMSSKIDSLTPNGFTNQGIGLAHGWMSLVGGGPYPTPPAKDPNYTYQEVIILLSDGLNTENRWYNDAEDIDPRQATTCANAKAAGFTIYTVHVNTGGDPMSTLLKNCASNSNKFFHLTQANAINTTFNQIGTALSNLRVAK